MAEQPIPTVDPKFTAAANIGNYKPAIKLGPDANYTVGNVSVPQETVDKINKQLEAMRFNTGKPDWSLFPFEAAEEIVKVLEFGAKKYAAWNFTVNGGLSWKDCCSSIARHLFAFMRGEDNDPESGLSHIAHVGCNVLFLLTYIKNKKEFNKDDRNKRV